MKKLKLDFDQLGEELEILDLDYLRGVKGGYGSTGGYGGYEGNYAGYGTEDNPIPLDEVEIDGGYGGYGNNGGGNTGGGAWWPPYNPGTGGGSGGHDPIGGGSGSPGGYSAPTEPTGWQVAQAAASGAIGFHDFYTTLDTWRTGSQPTNIGEVVSNIVDRNLVNSMWDDLKGASKFKGVAILNTAGHILGVVGVAQGLGKIATKYAKNQSPSAADWLDLGVSVGSMFIRSNAVGMAVSFGWMIVKGDFDNAMN